MTAAICPHARQFNPRTAVFPRLVEPLQMRSPGKHDRIALHSQARSDRHRSSALVAAVSAMRQSSPQAARSRRCRLPETSCIAPTPSKCAQVRRAVLQTSKRSVASAHRNRSAEDSGARIPQSRQPEQRHTPRSSGSQTTFRGYGRHRLSPRLHADHPRSAYKESSPQFFWNSARARCAALGLASRARTRLSE